ncbi:hypothetical protein N9M39_00010 [Halieaceae bacterium]|nr:hypothetical protein [Halieaceae bacterium]
MAPRLLPTALVALIAAVFFQQTYADTADLLGQLQICARVADNEARFACYDALGREALEMESTVSPAPAAVAVPAATAPEAAAPAENASPEDTIGGYKFEEKSADADEDGLKTRVVECQRSIEGIWYFRLQNGQIWKQVDRQTLNFQACDFPAVVAKDGLGYVLRIEGRKGKIRVSRRK